VCSGRFSMHGLTVAMKLSRSDPPSSRARVRVEEGERTPPAALLGYK